MSANRVFLDTNVLVYAHDNSAGIKQIKARGQIYELWASGRAILSTQVLQEFYAVATSKITQNLTREEARMATESMLKWQVVVNDGASILRAIDLQKRLGYSFWDCLIIDAAIQGGADILLSEDLTQGLEISGVKIVNPFLDS
jgi:predicted nucleic acid-binding protein